MHWRPSWCVTGSASSGTSRSSTPTRTERRTSCATTVSSSTPCSREGLARVSGRATSARTVSPRAGELQRAEREARSFRRGLWGYTAKNGLGSRRIRLAAEDS